MEPVKEGIQNSIRYEVRFNMGDSIQCEVGNCGWIKMQEPIFHSVSPIAQSIMSCIKEKK